MHFLTSRSLGIFLISYYVYNFELLLMLYYNWVREHSESFIHLKCPHRIKWGFFPRQVFNLCYRSASYGGAGWWRILSLVAESFYDGGQCLCLDSASVSSLLTTWPLAPPQLFCKRLDKYKFETMQFCKTAISASSHLHLEPVLPFTPVFRSAFVTRFSLEWLAACASYYVLLVFFTVILFKAMV